MKLDIQPLEDHQVKIIAEFEPEVFEGYIRRAARKIARQVRIPGFRPGKAPLDVIRRTVGEESLKEQALEDLVDENYSKILEEAQIKPGAAGSLEEIVSLDPPTFAFRIPLEPEVDLGAYRDIRLDYQLEEVSDDEVNEFIKRLQTNYATAEPVERPAENGDLVYLKFSAHLAAPEEGQDDVVFPERPAQFILGSDVIQDRDFPFPGFIDLLVGLSANDEKEFTYTYPEDAQDENLRGKEVIFKVAVQSIKAMHLPDIDDAFAQTVGQFETLEDLKKAVREQLEVTKKENTDEEYFSELIEKVVAGATIKYPPQVLDHEVEHMLEHLKEDLSRQGLEMDAYLKMIQKDPETFLEEEVRPAARKRLERSLVIEQLGVAENIKLEESDYNQVAATTMETLRSMPQPKSKKKGVSEQVLNNITMNAMVRTLNQRILDRMKAIATGQADAGESAGTEPEEEAAASSEPEPAPQVENNEVSPEISETTQPGTEETKPAQD